VQLEVADQVPKLDETEINDPSQHESLSVSFIKQRSIMLRYVVAFFVVAYQAAQIRGRAEITGLATAVMVVIVVNEVPLRDARTHLSDK
jgi:hypothetical protein